MSVKKLLSHAGHPSYHADIRRPGTSAPLPRLGPRRPSAGHRSYAIVALYLSACETIGLFWIGETPNYTLRIDTDDLRS